MKFQRKPSQFDLDSQVNQSEFVGSVLVDQQIEQLPKKPKSEEEQLEIKKKDQKKKRILILVGSVFGLMFLVLFFAALFMQRPAIEMLLQDQQEFDRTRQTQQYLNEDITRLIQQLELDLRNADPTLNELPFPQVRYQRFIL